MHVLYQTLMAEWQDSHVEYPEWLTTIVLDETYYAVTMIAVCANAFVMGLVLGFTLAAVA